MTNNVDGTGPSFASAVVENAAADELKVSFDEAVNLTVADGFSISTSSSGAVITGVGGGSGTTEITFTLDIPIEEGETVTVTFDGLSGSPDAADGIGNLVQDFSGQAVTNNVDGTAPMFDNAVVEDADRDDLVVTFDEPIVLSDQSGFSLNSDGSPVSITGVSGSGTLVLTFSLDRDINAVEVLTLDYNDAAGDAGDAGGNALGTFGVAESVTNNVLNSAPLLDAGQSPTLSNIDEDNLTSAGNTIAEIVVDASITDPEGAVEAIAVTVVDNTNGVWQYSLDNGSSWNLFSGTTGSSADITTAARLLDGTLVGVGTHKVRFVPDADYNGDATFTFKAWDRTGAGVAGGTIDATTGGGTTAFSTLDDVATITINPINDAPTLTGTVAFTAIDEDDVTNSGTSILSLITSFAGNYTDSDAGALAGLAVTGVSTTNGTWEFTLDGIGWTALAPTGDTDAVLLASDGNNAIRFVPSADYNGSTGNTISVRGWDQTSGSDGSPTNVSVNGGTTAFSAGVAATASITVNALNDAPTFNVVLGNQNVNSDAGAVSLPLFIDPATQIVVGPADENTQTLDDFTVSIFSDPNGVLVPASADIDNSGTLTYSVVSQKQGVATINVYIVDDGPTGSGNVNTSQLYQFTITVTDNQPPAITSRTPSNGASGQAARNTIQFVFNEQVTVGTGDIEIRDNSNTNLLTSVSVTDATKVQLTGGNTVDVTFDNYMLKNGKTYYVIIENGAFLDVNSSNSFALTSPTGWTFTMSAANSSAPNLLYTIPANGTLDVGVTQDIILVFDEVMRKNAGASSYVFVDKETSLSGPVISNDVIRINPRANDDSDFGLIDNATTGSNRVVINLDQSPVVLTSGVNGTLPFTFDENSFYSIQVDNDAFEDIQDDNSPAIPKFYFKTVADGTPPTLAAVNAGASPTEPFQPVDGATAVAVATSTIYATFNEPVAKGTGNVKIYADLSPSDLLISDVAISNGAFTVSGQQLAINLASLGVTLSGGITYYINIDNGAIKDLFNNSFAGISNSTTWNFTTANDGVAPVVSTLNPLDNTAEVGLSPTLTVTFSEPIKKFATPGTKYLRIYYGANDNLFAQVDANSVTIDANQATFSAGSAFPGFTDFYLKIDNGAFFDYSTPANNFAGISSKTVWNFKTTATGDVTPPVANFGSATPADGGNIITNTPSFSINFNEAITEGVGMISLFNAAGDVLTDSWDVLTDVNISGSTATFQLNIASLAYGASYYIQWPSGTFEDLLGNSVAANSNTTNWNFSVANSTVVTPASVLLCSNGDYTSIGTITISEGSNGGFSGGGTYTISLPVNFEFDVTSTPDFSGGTYTDISTPAVVSLTKSAFTFSYSASTSAAPDVISIDGLFAKFTGVADITTSAYRSAGTATQVGNAAADLQSNIDLQGVVVASPSLSYATYTDYYGENFTNGEIYNIVNVNVYDGYTFNAVDPVVTLNGANSDVRWYSTEDLATEVTSLYQNVAPSMGDLGLDDDGDSGNGYSPNNRFDSEYWWGTSVAHDPFGIHTWWVTNTNANGCESDPVKVRVVSWEIFGYGPTASTQLDEDQYTYYIYDTPANHTVTWSGPGLESPTGYFGYGGYKWIKFRPTTAGLGVHNLTATLKNVITGESYTRNFQVTVLPSTSILSSGETQPCVPITYGGSVVNEKNLYQINLSDLSSANYIFHKIEVYSSNLGGNLTSANVYAVVNNGGGDIYIPAADIFVNALSTTDYYDPTNGAYSPTYGYITNWVLDKTGLTSGYYYIRRYVTTSGDVDPEETLVNPSFIFGQEQIYLNAAPSVSISNLSTDNCESDSPIDLDVVVDGISYTNPSGNFYYQVHDGIGFGAEQLLDGGGTTLNFGVLGAGRYNLVYVSDGSEQAGTGCIGKSVAQEFFIYPIPVLPSVQAGASILNHGGLVSGDYLFEYCKGEVVDDVVAPPLGTGFYTWSSDLAGNNVLGNTNTLAATAIFGGTNTPNTTTRTFYLRETSSNGCASLPRKFTINVYDVPGTPIVIESGGDHIFNQGGGSYLIEYCDSEDIADIVLDATFLQTGLPVGKTSYFQWYEDDGFGNTDYGSPLLVGNILTPGDIGLNATGGNPVASSQTFHVVQYNDRDNSPGFVGCASAPTKVTISVFTTPTNPVATAGNGFRMQYYAVKNSTSLTADGVTGISFLNTPSGTSAVYRWYQDDGTGSAPSAFISESPILTVSDASLNGLDLATAGTYYFWVSQATSKNFVSSFQGCESDAVRVAITVFDAPTTPALTASTQTSYSYCTADDYSNDTYTIIVDVPPGYLGSQGAQEYRWYRSDASGNKINLNPVFIGAAPTAQQLGITGLSSTHTRYYMATNVTDIIGVNGAQFAGGESAGVVIQFDFFKTPAAIDIPVAARTYYYCEDDVDDTTIATLTATSTTDGVTFKWYYEGDIVFQEVDEDASAAAASTVNPISDFELSPGVPVIDPTVDGVYDFTVTQTDAGCESAITSASTIRINIFALPITPTPSNANPSVCLGQFEDPFVLDVTGKLPGARLNWYDGEGTLLANTDTYSPDINLPAGNYTYRVTQTTNRIGTDGSIFPGCESEAAEITYQVFDIGAAPEATGLLVNGQYIYEYCVGDDILDMEIVDPDPSITYRWYSDESRTTLVGDKPILAPPGVNNTKDFDRTYYVLKSSSDNGCISDDTEVRVIVRALPSLSFTQNNIAGNIAICVNAAPVALSAQDGIGTFFGNGVIDNGDGTATFNPLGAIDSLGIIDPQLLTESVVDTIWLEHTSTLQFVSGEGCYNSVFRLVTINPLPEVNFFSDGNFEFEDNSFTICVNAGAISLIGDPSGGTFTGPGITATTSGARFDPLSARTEDGAGLYGPATTYTIKYEYTNPATLCSNSVEKQIIVLPQPQIDFSINGGCSGEPVNFGALISNEVDLSGVSKLIWDFGDESDKYESASSTDRTVTHHFNITLPNATQQDFQVSLTVVSVDGCSSTFSKSVSIGSSPTPRFAWSGIIENQPTVFEIDDPGINIQSLANVTFQLYSGDELLFVESRDRNPALTDAAAQRAYLQGSVTTTLPTGGTYRGVLSLRSVNQCFISLERDVQILNVKTVTADQPYLATFDSGPEGWFADVTFNDDPLLPGVSKFELTSRPNSWENAVPGGSILNDEGLSRGWVTNADGNYNTEEKSWVYSPAFDISALLRPMVKFNLMYDFDGRKDGVVLQYSTDNGANWPTLGLYDGGIDEATGINWYTLEGIVSDPGGQDDQGGTDRVGWGGSTDEQGINYSEARHKLDEIAGNRSSVRFRFALGSDNSVDSDNPLTDEEGFAFDNFWIGERSKLVLLEKFTSTTSETSRTVDVTIKELLEDSTINNDDVIVLDYHTEFKKTASDIDPFNQVNKADPGARVLFYGINKVPLSIIAGDLSEGTFNASTTSNVPYSEFTLSKSSLIDPEVNISIEQLPSESKVLSLAVSYNKTGLRLPEDAEHRLYVVVIERYEEYQGNPYSNIVRKILPDGNGIRVENLRALDGVQTVNVVPWEISGKLVKDPEELAVVAFIQSNNSKLIYQSAILDIVGKEANATGVDLPGEIASSYALYPNPANTEVGVRFDSQLNNDFEWRLIDQAGATISNGRVQKGSEAATFDTRSVPSGMYFVIISNENARFEPKKLLIIH
ncbi:MAG: Ig-like domain-containing protein [Imperialibacter sp.]|uniref:Ig-like domain-containing protein n=1 Tax=Imperialibacter sp. TaxID=2038411 RepID=UPI0032EE6472